MIEIEEIRVLESRGEPGPVNNVLRSNIEGTVIKWAHQVDEILSMESQQELEAGGHPAPNIEIQFWESKCCNLLSLYDQVCQRKQIYTRTTRFYYR